MMQGSNDVISYRHVVNHGYSYVSEGVVSE